MIAKRIVVHCSATKNGVRVDASEIDKWHKARGWKGIGYHLVIQPNGEVQNGRPLNEQGAHCPEANADSIGICLIGTDKFHVEQLEAMRNQIENLCRIYSIPKWELQVHNQFKSAMEQGKTCPGFTVNDLLGFMWIDSKALKGVEL